MKYLIALLCVFLSISSAEARRGHHHRSHHHYHHAHHSVSHSRGALPEQNVMMNPSLDFNNPMYSFQGIDQTHTFGERTQRRGYRQISSTIPTQMLPHPAGCPRVAFCGCGAAVEKFGSPRRDLWQAAAWFKFPKVGVAGASSGDAMVRAHHVAILRQHIQGTVWLVADHNSGGHASRLHARDISGWVIVRPS